MRNPAFRSVHSRIRGIENNLWVSGRKEGLYKLKQAPRNSDTLKLEKRWDKGIESKHLEKTMYVA